MTRLLNIYPNSGVDKLRLGCTLYVTMKVLRLEEKDDGIEFKFKDEMNMIVVYLSKCGINLIFDKFLQTLVMIEIKLNDGGGSIVDGVQYGFKNDIIDKFTFKSIYHRYFGPTFQGSHIPSTCDYFLSYCGASFKFHGISLQNCSNEILSTIEKEYSCSSIFIYQNTEKNINTFLWNSFTNSLQKQLNMEQGVDYVTAMQNFCPPADDSNFNNKIQIKYVHYEIYNKEGYLTFYFSKHPSLKKYTVKCGDTKIQDMVKVFGYPDDYIIKKKVRLKSIQNRKYLDKDGNLLLTSSRGYTPIHLIKGYKRVSYKDSSNNFLENDALEKIKIHNYFDLGFDVLYDLNATSDGTNLVSRIVIHQNCIESVDFLRYEKLVLFYHNDSSGETFHWPTASEVYSTLQVTHLPIFLDKKEYSIQEDYEESKEADRAFEIIDLESGVYEMSQDWKEWGLSFFDGSANTIFEGLSKTNEICTITIHELYG